MQKERRHEATTYQIFLQQISSILLTRCFLLAPLERMKIIMQVKPLAQLVNPADLPKNAMDLVGKVNQNQGLFAFFRGNNALIYKLTLQHAMKFTLYETVFQSLNEKNQSLSLSILAASSFTALLTTLATYPLDLAHGRMAADMSKKPSILVNKNAPLQSGQKKLYRSVRDCITKTQEQTGVIQSRKFLNMFKGIQVGLAGQIPYTVILLSSFEGFNYLFDSKNITFDRKDDYLFLYKYVTRFGASTISLLLAQSICYPFDTVKRRMQLNGSQGHKNLYKSDWQCMSKIWKEEGYRGLYSGFGINLVRCVPPDKEDYIQSNQFAQEVICDSSIGHQDNTQYLDQVSECKAIPFIRFLQDTGSINKLQQYLGTFELNPEAGEFLQSLSQIKLGVVAVCGKYRTGKSYLLNKLFLENQNLQANNNGFQVSPTINPCTKGLWIWKKVLYSDNNKTPMILIDTEGLGAFDEDENHDAKIFMLALLLSSQIIYNSVGTIDETALNNLALVINLSKKIQLKNKSNSQEDVDGLAAIFPAFMWVLRDFTLQLIDSDGYQITSKQYLENALKEQKGYSEVTEQKNRVRRLLQFFFKERDCCTIVRPTEEEKELQDLIKLSDSQLRKEFVDQIQKLKAKVMNKVKVKVLNGHQMNGPMILELANSYIVALNQGEVPVIENAWTNVCNFEQERIYQESIKFLQINLQSALTTLNIEISLDDIQNNLKLIGQQSLTYLKQNFLGDDSKSIELFSQKLKNEVKQRIAHVMKETEYKYDKNIENQISQQFYQEVELKARRNQFEQLNQIFENIESIQKEVASKYPSEVKRVKGLLHFIVLSKMEKVLELFIQEKYNSLELNKRVLESKLVMQNEQLTQVKEEKNTMFEQMQDYIQQYEKESLEFIQSLKKLSFQNEDLKERNQDLVQQLKCYKEKDYRECSIQTEQPTKSQISLKSERILQNEIVKERTDVSTKDQDINTSLDMITDDKFVEKQSLLLQDNKQCIEHNIQLLNEILNTLNSQNNQLSLNLSEEFQQILKNNQQLSNAIDQSEKRNTYLEKKIQKKKKFSEMVKSCQRLQCQECNKLYTPALFGTHIVLCKKQQQTLRQSAMIDKQYISNENVKSPVKQQVERKSEIKIFENNNIRMNRINTGVTTPTVSANMGGTPYHNVYNDNSQYFEDQFLAKIVEMNHLNLDSSRQNHESFSPSKPSYTLSPGRQDQNFYGTSGIEFKICVLYKGVTWYINRNLKSIKNLMKRYQKNCDLNKTIQAAFTKMIMDFEVNEQLDNYYSIQEIIETFFIVLYKKVIQKSQNASFNKTVKLNTQALKDFTQFFEIPNENGTLKNKKYPLLSPEQVFVSDYVDQDDMIHMECEDLLQLERNVPFVRTTETVLDEVTPNTCGQLPMDASRNPLMQAQQSAIYHESENENNSLHFVSFFSIGGEENKKQLSTSHDLSKSFGYKKYSKVDNHVKLLQTAEKPIVQHSHKVSQSVAKEEYGLNMQFSNSGIKNSKTQQSHSKPLGSIQNRHSVIHQKSSSTCNQNIKSVFRKSCQSPITSKAIENERMSSTAKQCGHTRNPATGKRTVMNPKNNLL